MSNNNNSPWGIDFIDSQSKEQQDQLIQEQKDLNKLYFTCFNTPAGKKVLEHLKKCTLEQPTWIPSKGHDAIHSGFIREGQNSIVRSITDRINQSKK